MSDFKIFRRKWRCGGYSSKGVNSHGKGETSLLNNEGYMCCLGQCATQLGVRKNKLLLKSTPEDISLTAGKKRIPVLTLFDGNDTQLSEHAMDINDDDTTTLEEKEVLLKRLFSKFNHSIEFVGKYEQ